MDGFVLDTVPKCVVCGKGMQGGCVLGLMGYVTLMRPSRAVNTRERVVTGTQLQCSGLPDFLCGGENVQ